MAKTGSRLVAAIVAMLAAGFAGATSAGAQTPQRESIAELDAEEVRSLRRGYAQMIAWNDAPRGSADYKRSLRYWANMHAYIGPGCTGSDSGLANPGMEGLSSQTKTTADEIATWCTCQHSPRFRNNLHFLTWHRMYLYYFEKVLQEAAQDPNLRLPFWDYETDGHIPAAYRDRTYVDDSGRTVPNPLYVANRQEQLNAGTAALLPQLVRTDAVMTESTYPLFNHHLEASVHGNVHCATGVSDCPSGYMAFVPTAGNDPIFFSHHANIDRLYECWLRAGPPTRLPPEEVRTRTFSFIDGSGTLVTRAVGDMLTLQQLGYSYAGGGGCPRPTEPGRGTLLSRPLWGVLPLATETRLEDGTARIPLRVSAPLRTHLFASDGGAGATAGSGQARVVIENVTAERPPETLLEVVMRASDGRTVPVGVINFFNHTAPHGEGAHDDAPLADASRAFDVTEALQVLGGEAVELLVRPTRGITSAAAAPPEPSEDADVRFGRARLELR